MGSGNGFALDVSVPAGSIDGSSHVVQFYEGEAFLAETVARFIGDGLAEGDAAVVIATPSHQDALEKGLHARGLDLATLRHEGRYVALDAARTLSQFMLDGSPDETRFGSVVGSVIARAAGSQQRRVRAFGEMVALLCAAGDPESVIRLEELWNALAQKLPFSLLCGYPVGAFRGEALGEPFGKVCRAHSHVIPAESYTALGSPEERLRSIAYLQQKATALDAETAERKRVEQIAAAAVRQSHQTLRAVVAASPLPIVVIEADTTVRLWNPAAERLFGWTASEVVGREIPNVPPDKLVECRCVRDAVMRGESFSGIETCRIRRDGSKVDVLISAAPLANGQGATPAMVLLFEDVTARKRAEAEREELLGAAQRARADAEAASRAKDEFLAMLSHELRNPLSAVRNALVTARLDDTRREPALEIARRQTEQLTRLVDDLLDVARITQGRIVLRKEPLYLTEVIERAVETSRALIEDRGHTLSVSLPSGAIRVDGDATRLEQVVVNLLSNAAKYTERGGRIELLAERHGREAVLRVRDSGIGIAPDMLPRVFDLFAQSERALDRAQGGLGIGLTVVRSLVQLHGGTVAAHSEGLGKGAEFVVRLPALPEVHADEVTPRPREERTHPQVRVRVLLVEDNSDAADSLAMLLELLGHHVRVAHDGVVALEVAPANVPDVMLVDIGLPGIDGYEVARRVRQHPELKHVVLVALTGYGREEDRRRALAAGFDYHLVKPVDPDLLQGLVARLPTTSPERTLVH